MNHTTNYQLNQWEATDRVTRADFNADNAAIDTALKTVADAAAAAQSAASGAPKLAAGTYAPGTLSAGTRYNVTVGFRPRAVLITSPQFSNYAIAPSYDALVLDGVTFKGRDDVSARAGITDTGFYVVRNANGNTAYPALAEPLTYHYLAFG